MAKLASKTRILKLWQATTFIIATICSNYILFIVALAWQDYWMGRSAVSLCLKDDHAPSQPVVPILLASKITICVAFGFACDLSLYFFVRKRNKVEPVGTKMVPWKSGNNVESEEDLYIPIRASVVSSLFMLFSVLIIGCGLALAIRVPTGSSLDETFYWCFVSGVILTSCGAPVAMIFFTVKTQDKEKSKVNKSQPPQGLQFHEDSEGATHQSAFNKLHFYDENDDMEMADDGIEMNVIVNSNPHQCQDEPADLNIGQ